MSYFSICSEPGKGREEFCLLTDKLLLVQGLEVESQQARVLSLNNSVIGRTAQAQGEKENLGILGTESLRKKGQGKGLSRRA